jgi:hypothetical protein
MPAVLHSQRSGERPTSPWRATSRREGCPAVDPRQRAEADFRSQRATRLRLGMPAVLHSQRSGEHPTSPWRATSRQEGCPAVDPRQRAEADESRAGRGSSF